MADENTNDSASPIQDVAPSEGAQQTTNQEQIPEPVKEPAPQDSGELNGFLDDTAEADEENKAEGQQSQEESQEEAPSVLGAPEEGYNFEEFDPSNEAVKYFSDQAKDLNLSQDAAHSLLSKSIEGVKAQMRVQREALHKAASSDRDLNINDKVVRSNVSSAYKRYFGGDAQLDAMLRAMNLDVNPAFLRACKRIGEDISEGGKFVQGTSGGSGATDYRAFYKNTRMNR